MMYESWIIAYDVICEGAYYLYLGMTLRGTCTPSLIALLGLVRDTVHIGRLSDWLFHMGAIVRRVRVASLAHISNHMPSSCFQSPSQSPQHFTISSM